MFCSCQWRFSRHAKPSLLEPQGKAVAGNVFDPLLCAPAGFARRNASAPVSPFCACSQANEMMGYLPEGGLPEQISRLTRTLFVSHPVTTAGVGRQAPNAAPNAAQGSYARAGAEAGAGERVLAALGSPFAGCPAMTASHEAAFTAESGAQRMT